MWSIVVSKGTVKGEAGVDGGMRGRGKIRCQYSFAPSVMRSGFEPTAN
jgi:hypothetical protein